MSKQETDILYFVSFCVEQYKMRKGISGSEVMALFDKCGVTEYLCNHYDVLHTQGASWLMEEIEEFINKEGTK